MAEMICRALRDGSVEGEHAPALTIKDSISSPFGFNVFTHVLTQLSSNILAGKSQSLGIVIVAVSQSPLFYFDLLKSQVIDAALSYKWIWILDCYTDPLGWKGRLYRSGNHNNSLQGPQTNITVCSDVKDLGKLLNLVIEHGIGLVGQDKGRFSIAIDSISELLRHASTSAVAEFLSNLRSADEVSSILWLLHSDLDELRVTAVMEYMSSMVASVEPTNQLTNGQRGELDSLPLVDENLKKGMLNVRFKRRNGRVRLMSEEFHVEQSAIKFMSVSCFDGSVNNQGILPKLQFNLQLSEKELNDRAQVVLPFEHQGIGKAIQIYDGRTENCQTIDESFSSSDSLGKGQIIYFRDSDDERPDSDEDPDDDLDI